MTARTSCRASASTATPPTAQKPRITAPKLRTTTSVALSAQLSGPATRSTGKLKAINATGRRNPQKKPSGPPPGDYDDEPEADLFGLWRLRGDSLVSQLRKRRKDKSRHRSVQSGSQRHAQRLGTLYGKTNYMSKVMQRQIKKAEKRRITENTLPRVSETPSSLAESLLTLQEMRERTVHLLSRHGTRELAICSSKLTQLPIRIQGGRHGVGVQLSRASSMESNAQAQKTPELCEAWYSMARVARDMANSLAFREYLGTEAMKKKREEWEFWDRIKERVKKEKLKQEQERIRMEQMYREQELTDPIEYELMYRRLDRMVDALRAAELSVEGRDILTRSMPCIMAQNFSRRKLTASQLRSVSYHGIEKARQKPRPLGTAATDPHNKPSVKRQVSKPESTAESKPARTAVVASGLASLPTQSNSTARETTQLGLKSSLKRQNTKGEAGQIHSVLTSNSSLKTVHEDPIEEPSTPDHAARPDTNPKTSETNHKTSMKPSSKNQLKADRKDEASNRAHLPKMPKASPKPQTLEEYVQRSREKQRRSPSPVLSSSRDEQAKEVMPQPPSPLTEAPPGNTVAVERTTSMLEKNSSSPSSSSSPDSREYYLGAPADSQDHSEDEYGPSNLLRSYDRKNHWHVPEEVKMERKRADQAVQDLVGKKFDKILDSQYLTQSPIRDGRVKTGYSHMPATGINRSRTAPPSKPQRSRLQSSTGTGKKDPMKQRSSGKSCKVTGRVQYAGSMLPKLQVDKQIAVDSIVWQPTYREVSHFDLGRFENAASDQVWEKKVTPKASGKTAPLHEVSVTPSGKKREAAVHNTMHPNDKLPTLTFSSQ